MAKKMQIIKPNSVTSAVLIDGKPSLVTVVKNTRRNPPARRTERQRLRELELRGEIRLGSGRVPDDFWSMPMPCDPEGSVRQALIEDRR